MVHDIEQLLHRTAAEPSQRVEAAEIVGRGRRRRRWRHGFAGASGLALVVVAVLVVVPGLERPTVQFDPPVPHTDPPVPHTDPPVPHTDPPVPHTDPPAPRTALTGDEWEVMAVGVVSPPQATESRIATTQEALDEAWAGFDMEGPAPVLPARQAALLGHVAGDCDDPSQVLGLERVPADSASGLIGEFAVMHVDADCAFIDRFGTNSPDPRTLYVIGVPAETTDNLVHLVPVSAPVTDPEWRLLGVVPGLGEAERVGLTNQAWLDEAWPEWVGEDEAPEIPEGWTPFVASVPGTCSDPSQLRDVRSLGYDWGDDAMKTVGLAVLFDPACAEVEDLEARLDQSQSHSVYVIIVPTEVAFTLHGPWEYITCEEDNDVGACHGSDRTLIHAYW